MRIYAYANIYIYIYIYTNRIWLAENISCENIPPPTSTSIPMYLHKYAKLKTLFPTQMLCLILILSRTHIFLHLIYNPRLPSRWTILCINKCMPLHSLTPALTTHHRNPAWDSLMHKHTAIVSPLLYPQILHGNTLFSSHSFTKPGTDSFTDIYIHPTLKVYSRQQKVNEKFLAQVL